MTAGFKLVLEPPQNSVFWMSPILDTPSSVHELIQLLNKGDIKNIQCCTGGSRNSLKTPAP